MLRMVTLSLLKLSFLTSLGCSSSVKLSPQQQLVTLFGGQDNLDIVREAVDVHAERIEYSYVGEGSLVDRTKVLAGPVSLNQEQSVDLSRWLVDESSYGWDYGKPCAPSYGLRFEFRRREKVVSIWVCLSCGTLAVVVPGGKIGGEDCDAIRARIFALAKDLFPNDEGLQAFELGIPEGDRL